MATKTATYLKADKLIFLGEQQGLLNEEGQLLRELSPHQLDYYIQQYQTSSPTLTLHLQEAKKASLSGVHRVHLIHMLMMARSLKNSSPVTVWVP